MGIKNLTYISQRLQTLLKSHICMSLFLSSLLQHMSIGVRVLTYGLKCQGYTYIIIPNNNNINLRSTESLMKILVPLA